MRGCKRSGGKCRSGADEKENNLASDDFSKIGKMDIFRKGRRVNGQKSDTWIWNNTQKVCRILGWHYWLGGGHPGREKSLSQRQEPHFEHQLETLRYPAKRELHGQDRSLHGRVTYAMTQGPMLTRAPHFGLMLCCHHLEIFEQETPHFYFA